MIQRVVVVALVVTVVGVLLYQQLAIRDLRVDLDLQQATIDTLKPAPTTESRMVEIEPNLPQVALDAAQLAPQPVSPQDAETLREVAKFARAWAGTESAQMTEIGKQLKDNPGGAVEALEDLVPRMDKERSYQRMELALMMLDQVDPKTSSPALRRLYDNQGSAYLKGMVAGMLAKRGDDSILQDFLSKLAVRGMRSSDPAVRRSAVGALAQTKNPLSTPYIVGMLKDENLQVRIQATYALGTVKGEAAIQELYKLQENSSPAVRDAANRSLEELEREQQE